MNYHFFFGAKFKLISMLPAHCVIEDLFEELTVKYLKLETMKYINMELFKKDFI
jgi:hypothetical protein